jgi:putative flippase GtrA
MKKLLAQISKFVIVGGLSFVLDFVVYLVLTRGFSMVEMVAQILAFSVSLIFNYFMSMRFVFVSKDTLKKHEEFGIFVTLSVMGAGLNWGLFYVMVYLFTIDDLWTKVVVAGVVMVFNFVTRKIFLEQKTA